MVGSKTSFETVLRRLFMSTVAKVGLATLRCLVNTYDVMLNEPDGLKGVAGPEYEHTPVPVRWLPTCSAHCQ